MVSNNPLMTTTLKTGSIAQTTSRAHKARLLLVDSRNTWSVRLGQALSDISVEFDILPSAHQALSFLQTNFCDALLLEANLPDIPAAEMVALAKRRFLLLPIIVFADESAMAEAIGALNAGAIHLIPSSFEPRQMIAVLRKVLALQTDHVTPARFLPGLKQTIQFALPSSVDYIVSAANQLTEALIRFNIVTVEEINIKIALVEALTNAMEHGNGFDPARRVKVEAKFLEDRAEIKITDEGKGFNHRHLPNPTSPENLYKPRGRGIYMMYRLMDEVHFNRKGNSVRLIKYRRPLRLE
jgi:serine/threonine-protein kinase RsbW